MFLQFHFSHTTGPPGEPGRVYANSGSITTSSVGITWSIGADNGKNVLYYVVEGKPELLNEWAILLPCKYENLWVSSNIRYQKRECSP